MSERVTEVKLAVDLAEITQHIDGLFEQTWNRVFPLIQPNKLMYTAEEAAEAMGVPVSKINLWRKKGLITWVKVGTKYNYPTAGLLKFVSDYQFYKVGTAEDCELAILDKRKGSQATKRAIQR